MAKLNLKEKIEPREDSVDPLYDLWVLFARTYYIISKNREQEVYSFGISRPMAYLLFVIDALGDKATPSRISKNTIAQFSTVSEMLDRMVESKLITKVRITDGRHRIKVKLTKKGNTILQKSIKRESLHKAMLSLDEKKRRQLRSCLRILLNATLADFNQNLPRKELTTPPSKLAIKKK